ATQLYRFIQHCGFGLDFNDRSRRVDLVRAGSFCRYWRLYDSGNDYKFWLFPMVRFGIRHANHWLGCDCVGLTYSAPFRSLFTHRHFGLGVKHLLSLWECADVWGGERYQSLTPYRHWEL